MPGPLAGEAKLVKPPPPAPLIWEMLGFRTELVKLEKPVPVFEAAVTAKGEGPAAPANPTLSAAGFCVVEGLGLKMDDVFELASELKGDTSDPANAARPDEANAE